MYKTNMRATALQNNAFKQTEDMPPIATPAELHFTPGFPGEIINLCWAMNQENEVFHLSYPQVTIDLYRSSTRNQYAGITTPDYRQRTQKITIFAHKNDDLTHPFAGADAAYVLLHEIFVHAAANSWDFAGRSSHQNPTSEQSSRITHSHHMNLLLPAGESNDYHQFIKKASRHFRFPPARERFILRYVDDIEVNLNKLIENQVLTDREKVAARTWLARLQTEARSPESLFWKP